MVGPHSASSTITEENRESLSRLEVALNSPVSRPSRLSSTPVRSNGETAEDSLDQDPGGSPISMFPCTQDSGGEVAWDWTGARETEGRNALLSITPKRRQNVKKKRLENSPLLNLNLRRKIVRNENVEGIIKFAEEFQALAETIESERKSEAEKKAKVLLGMSENDKKNGGIGEEVESLRGAEEEERDKDWADISEMETQVVKRTETESDIHEVKTLRFNVDKKDVGLDELFDDSIDASMVQCSQEIEEKMRLECSEGLSEKAKENDDKSEIPASQIPDDSFDDCLALCMDDDHDLVSKFLEPERSGNDRRENLSVTRTKEPAEIRTYAKRKQQCRGSDDAPATQQSWKFFKTKSHSDPLNPNANSRPGGNPSSTISRSSSNLNLSSIGRTEDLPPVYESGNSIVPSAGSRNDSSMISAPSNSRVSNSYLRNVGNVSSPVQRNTGIYDFYVKPGMPIDKSVRNARGFQPSYTPAEIAKKRADAKAKLEASRLKKQNSFAKLKSGISLSAVKRPSPVKK